MKIKDVIAALDVFAPLPLQEDYDNAGLQVGLTEAELSGALLCLDATEAIVDEAIRKGCNLIVTHHPLIFHRLRQIGDRDYVQRTVMKAIKHDITIVSMHTNLDSAEENLRTATIGFEAGVISTSTVLSAQTAWLSAHSDCLDAGTELQMAAAALSRAEGCNR